MKFRFNIEARRIGGIGVKQRFIVDREAPDRGAAQLKLYDEYEHINVVSVEILSWRFLCLTCRAEGPGKGLPITRCPDCLSEQDANHGPQIS